MNNDITELRSHLFDTLRGLKEGTVDVEKAKAMSQLADTIIDTAKVEVDYMRVAGGNGTGFIPSEGQPQITPTSTGTKIVEGSRTIHRLK